MAQGADAGAAWVTGSFVGSRDAPDTFNLWPADYALAVTYRLGRHTLEVLAEIASQGVLYTVLTNRNHVRASEKVRSKTGAPTFIHPADAAEAERLGAVVDEYIEAGQKFGQLVVHPAAGKSSGEVCLHWPERKALFIGDACKR